MLLQLLDLVLVPLDALLQPLDLLLVPLDLFRQMPLELLELLGLLLAEVRVLLRLLLLCEGAAGVADVA